MKSEKSFAGWDAADVNTRPAFTVGFTRSLVPGRSDNGARLFSRAFLGDGVSAPRNRRSDAGWTLIPSPDLPSRRPQVRVCRQQRHRISARDAWPLELGRRSTRARSIRTPRYPRRTSKPRSCASVGKALRPSGRSSASLYANPYPKRDRRQEARESIAAREASSLKGELMEGWSKRRRRTRR